MTMLIYFRWKSLVFRKYPQKFLYDFIFVFPCYLDQKLWDFIGEEDNVASIKQAMEIKLQPLIIPTLMKVNSKLHFLAEGLSYVPDERPAMISMYKIFRLCLNEGN